MRQRTPSSGRRSSPAASSSDDALAAVRAAGRSRGRVRSRRRSRWGRGIVIALALLGIAAAALWWSLPDVKALAKAPPKSTAFIDLRRHEAEAAHHRFTLRWTWQPLERISPFLLEAVVLSEDARFWEHEGVDWDAVEKAAEKNLEKGRIAVGASTITQQVAKNLYLSPSKNPVRKLREMLITRRLEAELSKERILEIYLNVAEWGDGVFGAEAAARRWFGCSALNLAPAQAARLALALPNPRQRAPTVRSAVLDRRAARLVSAMERHGLIPQAAPAAPAAPGVESPAAAPGEPAAPEPVNPLVNPNAPPGPEPSTL
jgi:monofunctional biosynthetic peptidoglycan transglycosylase